MPWSENSAEQIQMESSEWWCTPIKPAEDTCLVPQQPGDKNETNNSVSSSDAATLLPRPTAVATGTRSRDAVKKIKQSQMKCADLTDSQLIFFVYVVFYVSRCTVYLLLHLLTYENIYAGSRMCWRDSGQEQQSAKSLIIAGGHCEAFWGCQCDRTREGGGRNARLNVAFRGQRCAPGTCRGMSVRRLDQKKPDTADREK